MLRAFVILYFFHLSLVASEKEIKVEIRNGVVSGRTFTSVQNKTVFAFQEIPYAQPPVGNLRFKDPLPAKNWSGVLEATKNTKICWEARYNVLEGDPRQNEDCLYLNVYSPVPPGLETGLPVWVYVYGGRFLFGHGSLDYIDPQLIVDSGIVAVTLNYRSGPLGFLTTEDGVIPSNLGLKDQHLALKWVQDNIQYFGGDPAKVVLNGQSSGAVCVSHHILSPRTKGLFRGAILQSGTSIASWSITKRARFWAFEMGKLLSPNFTHTNSSGDLLNVLLKTSARKITYAQIPGSRFKKNILEQAFVEMKWKPVIERADDPNAYLINLPHDSMVKGNFQTVPVLMGIASEESLFYSKEIPTWAASMDENTIFFENNNVKFGLRRYLEKRMRQIYTNSSFQHDTVALIKYASDYLFAMNVIRAADLHSKFAATYFYQFSYYGKMNALLENNHEVNVKGLGNVGHGEDLPYLVFYPGKAEEIYQFPNSDRFIQKRLIKLWTNFVKYLNPTHDKEFLAEFKSWPKINKNNFSYLDIDTNLSIISDYPKTYKEWIPLIENYFQHPLATI